MIDIALILSEVCKFREEKKGYTVEVTRQNYMADMVWIYPTDQDLHVVFG